MEQYLYLVSVLPPGTSVDQVFETIKHNPDWQASTGINDNVDKRSRRSHKTFIHKNLRMHYLNQLFAINMIAKGLSIGSKII